MFFKDTKGNISDEIPKQAVQPFPALKRESRGLEVIRNIVDGVIDTILPKTEDAVDQFALYDRLCYD